MPAKIFAFSMYVPPELNPCTLYSPPDTLTNFLALNPCTLTHLLTLLFTFLKLSTSHALTS